MPLTAEQLQQRRKSLGSSDVPAILGLGFRTAYDIWLDKTKADDLDAPAPMPPEMAFGAYMEAGLLDWAEAGIGRLDRNVVFRRPELHLHSTLDGYYAPRGRPVEAKTVNRFAETYEEWGRQGSGEIPFAYILQCQTHLVCLEEQGEADLCYVPALLAGSRLAMYYVRRDDELCKYIADYARGWWEKYVIGGTPPDIAPPSLSVVERFKRRAGASVKMPAKLVKDWRSLRDARLVIEKAEAGAKARVLVALHGADIGDAGKLGTVENMPQTGAPTIDRAKMEEEGVLAKYLRDPKPFRVLRFKEPKR